jgi:2,5-diketo-D-gluconate reductase B
MEPLPPVGLGTMGIEDPATVTSAIAAGYRHLDTAQIYGNESVVGAGLAAGGVAREELFVATKVWADSLAYDDVLSSTEASLDRLGLGSVNLLYVHRPIETYDPPETLTAFDELHERGRVGHIGVSNFTVENLREAREHLETPLFANQVEFHPLFRPTAALADAREHGYWLVAYAPLAGGRVFDLPAVSAVAAKHGTTEAAVAIAWLTAKERVVVIPKASSPAHLRANLEAADLELDAEDVARIDAIEEREELFPE